MKVLVFALLTLTTVVSAKADFRSQLLPAATKHAIQLSQKAVISKYVLKFESQNMRIAKRSYDDAEFFEEFADYVFTLNFTLRDAPVICRVQMFIGWDVLRKRDTETVLEANGDYQLIIKNDRATCEHQ